MPKIIAIGGGENGRPTTKYETKKIDKEIVSLSGKKKPKLLFIPPPSAFQENYFKIIKKNFSKLGCKVSVLYLTNKKPKIKEIKQKILSTDIIFVGGGNTLNLMKYFRKHKIDKIIKKAAKKNIILSGLSAGAICWFKFGCSDSIKANNPKSALIKLRALNLISAVLCPHYDENGRKTDSKKIIKRTTEVGIALDNCTAIEIINNQYKIITSKKQAKAYKVYYKKGKFYQEELRTTKELSFLNNLLTK